MAEYKAPIDDFAFTLKHLVKIDKLAQHDTFSEASTEMVDAILSEAAKVAEREVAPTNWNGDQAGATLDEQHAVTTPEGFKEAYQAFSEGGWGSLQFDPNYGGQGLPLSLSVAVNEMVQSANLAWSLCPLLTQGAIEAIHANASDALKQQYLPNMISGQWTGTMNLTEPQAGSDLALIKTTASRDGDQYRIKGQKIFITWGEHDVAENIIHLVLARLPGAPEGVKGISLFIVPKFLPNNDGSLGERNDCKALSLEHKLGIHGSPTCVMSFGENNGAIGFLVGEENRGLACMFTMMNNARLMVGVQGTAIAERALQDALAFAEERKQGIAPGAKTTSAISEHPDVERMLLTMRSLTEAARAIGFVACGGLDYEQTAEGDEAIAACASRVSLLTPIVKGWNTEIAQEVTSLGVQVHGGMGFIEETGAAQHLRDARILPIYEGTTGIQAMDLVGRKTLHDKGAAFAFLLHDIREDCKKAHDTLPAAEAIISKLLTATDKLEDAIDFLLKNTADHPRLMGDMAHSLLQVTGYVCGGWQMLNSWVACEQERQADGTNTEYLAQKEQTAHFYLQHLLPRYLGYSASIKALEEAIG